MIANVLTGVVALIHVYIVVLEMFLWDTERGRKAFGMTAEFSAATKVLVAGLYGAATASRRILYVQALPAALALIAVWAGV